VIGDLVGWKDPRRVPVVGQKLKVEWKDGTIYDADYLGKMGVQYIYGVCERNVSKIDSIDYFVLFQVLFEDESRLELKRDSIFFSVRSDTEENRHQAGRSGRREMSKLV
jgi:hypothetical protein